MPSPSASPPPLWREKSVSIAAPFEVGESPAGNYLSARVAEAEHDTLAASTFLRETLRSDPHNPELIQRAFVAALANGDMPEAFDLAQKLVARDPHNSSARLTLTVRDFKAKSYAAARNELNAGVTGGQKDLTTILLTAWSYVGSGDVRRALALVDTMSDPSFAVFRDFHAGLMLDVAGRTQEAGVRLKAAYAGDQTTLRLIDAYARNLSRQGKNDEAKAVYLAFDKVQPRNPIVQAALADLAAGKKLEPMVSDVNSGAAEVLYGLGAYGLGAASGRQGDEIAAIVFLRLSLVLAPDNALALDTLGEAYSKIRQYESAVDIYDQVPDASPLRVTTDVRIALLLDAMGRSDDSVKRLREIVAQNPQSVDAWSALADVLRSRKLFAESADAYSRVLDLTSPTEKSRWAVYYFRGVDYERAKMWDKAEPDLQKALELYPEQPLVLNYLGYSWVDQNMHLDEAFKMLRRAVELQPEDGYIVDSARLGALQARPLRRGRRPARARHRTEAGRPGHQRPSRRRLLAGGAQDRRAIPVEPRARSQSGPGRPAEDPRQDRKGPAGRFGHAGERPCRAPGRRPQRHRKRRVITPSGRRPRPA